MRRKGESLGSGEEKGLWLVRRALSVIRMASTLGLAASASVMEFSSRGEPRAMVRLVRSRRDDCLRTRAVTWWPGFCQLPVMGRMQEKVKTYLG